MRIPRAGMPWGSLKYPNGKKIEFFFQQGVSRMVEKSLTITGMYDVKLLAYKTKIASMKTHIIPRLEMMSGRILARLMARIKTALEAEV